MATKKTRAFVRLDENGRGELVEETTMEATPEEILALVGTKAKEITAVLTGIIPNGVLFVDASDRGGGRYATRSWGFVMRLPFLRLQTTFVDYKRSDGTFCIIPQPVQVDMSGTGLPGGEKRVFDWVPPEPFTIMLARYSGNTYAALIHKQTKAAFRLPLGNCFADGKMCMGSGLNLPEGLNLHDSVKRIVTSFLGVAWTQDLTNQDDLELVGELFAFTPDDSGKQLPPLMDAAVLLGRMTRSRQDDRGWGAKLGLPADLITGMQAVNWEEPCK